MLFIYYDYNGEPISVYRRDGASYQSPYWVANIRDYLTSVNNKNGSSSCNTHFFFTEKTITWYIKDVYTRGPYGDSST